MNLSNYDAYILNDRLKSIIETPQVAQRSEEWFEMRKTRITGSVVDTILGSNPYQKVDQLIAEKAGMPTQFKGNEATRHGTFYEPIATELYEKITGRKVIEFGLVPHETVSILAHSPDGLSLSKTEEPVLLEIKCPLRRKIEDKVPKYYFQQLQLGMETFDVNEAHFFQYSPEPEKYQLTIVHREEGWLEKHMPTFEKFWKDVEYWKEKGWQSHPCSKLAAQKEILHSQCLL